MPLRFRPVCARIDEFLPHRITCHHNLVCGQKLAAGFGGHRNASRQDAQELDSPARLNVWQVNQDRHSTEPACQRHGRGHKSASDE
jgi:hypothetical protein